MFLKAGSTVVSPWHDVPLYADASKGLLNFICEIPKETKAKARAGCRCGLEQREIWLASAARVLRLAARRWRWPRTRRTRPSSRIRRRGSCGTTRALPPGAASDVPLRLAS